MTDAAATSNANLRRGSLLMSLGTFASRASGQVRAVLLVAAVGSTGAVANAFDIGNRLPNILFALIAAGVLQAVLIPQILRAMKAHNSQERLDKLLTLSGVGILVMTGVVAALTPWLVRLMTLKGNWPEEHLQLAIVFAYWCVAQVFFYGLFALLGQVLNARGRFAAFGWAPVANNVVSIIGFGLFVILWGRAPEGGITDVSGWTTTQTVVLAGTATLGIAAQALLLIVPLYRSGFRWHFRLGLRGIGLRSAGKVVGWTLGAVGLEQVGTFFLTNYTSAADQAAAECVAAAHQLAAAAQQAAVAACPVIAGNAAYSQALTLYLLPHSLAVVSIVTALFPRMSAAAAAGDLAGVRRDMSTGLRTAGIFSVISAAVLLVLARPLTKALFPTMTDSQVDVGAPVLQAMALGLVALGMTVMVKRMYFAFEDGRGIFVIQVFATGSLIVAVLVATQFFPREHWAVVAAGAYAFSTWVSVLLRIRGMSTKLHGMDGPRILRLYVRAALAAAVAAAAGWGVSTMLGANDDMSWGRALLITAVSGLVMLGFYLAGLKTLHVRELDDALRPLLRRLRRG
ncbi:virulence factor MVIN family protein [Xylanimonas cellulosilytica DSM 15894]|uniref:Virulence factor MVIN family protein n=1 Tax=Xylanimonas cellulosilytica (strain DSM 15894 / JCM 12276 / CECT 5975 / KCTC 9989 / LMG 20990 / NBRC 107835 / XIL07) TaxID=446471 RepID=D1BRU8_XYLCX|nr:lipid II flippase MurJ [Xylanimonas cellulosilytica]ACZ32364.1 virulence factor MVIN family protein [Xylanimonas cellulosilytica DSM 15894]